MLGIFLSLCALFFPNFSYFLGEAETHIFPFFVFEFRAGGPKGGTVPGKQESSNLRLVLNFGYVFAFQYWYW